MKGSLLASMFLTAAAGAASADAPEPPSTTVGLASAVDTLSNSTPSWHERTLSIRRQLAKRQGFGVEITDQDRFGLQDSHIGGDYTFTSGDQSTLTLTAGFSPTHRVLARDSAGITNQYEFAPGWLLLAGGKTAGYDAVRVNQALFGVERYVSAFSWSALWHPTRAYGMTAHSGELRGYYYYGDRNSIGVIVAAGIEATNVGTAIVLAHVRSAAIVGVHQLDRHWSVNYAISRTQQDIFYNRTGLSAGVQYTF
jgi:YaiO family outer membrane protein